jgi:hypothetical protein
MQTEQRFAKTTQALAEADADVQSTSEQNQRIGLTISAGLLAFAAWAMVIMEACAP